MYTPLDLHSYCMLNTYPASLTVRTCTPLQTQPLGQPQTPAIRVPQLLPRQDLGAAEGAAVGAKAAVLPAHSGLAIAATTSNRGHPELPRGVAATSIGVKMLCQLPGTTRQLVPPESRGHPQSPTGVLLMGNCQTLLGDLRELRLIPVFIHRKLDV